MSHPRLTPRPLVPVLVRAAAFGALVMGPLGCGDDKGGDEGSNDETFDTAPTAGPCFHDGGDLPECQTTGDSGPAETTFDDAPTAGPCYHDPGLPECASTGADGTSTGDTDATGSSGSDTGSSSSDTGSSGSDTGSSGSSG